MRGARQPPRFSTGEGGGGSQAQPGHLSALRGHAESCQRPDGWSVHGRVLEDGGLQRGPRGPAGLLSPGSAGAARTYKLPEGAKMKTQTKKPPGLGRVHVPTGHGVKSCTSQSIRSSVEKSVASVVK